MQRPDFGKTRTEGELESLLSEPYPEDVEFAGQLSGDLLLLGAGGKMGPTLVKRITQARRRAGKKFDVIAVSRFPDRSVREELTAAGANVLSADLLDEDSLTRLPRCPNVIFMAGMKFGATGNQPLTWVMNSYLPGRIAETFQDSRIVAFSTGNVYPLVSPETGGCDEATPPDPVGEYAQSCLGRERIFQYFSERYSTPTCLLRLNYAVEARYGVVLDLAQKICSGVPISLRMGYVNIIWQGDANSISFRALALCESPAKILNLTGSTIFSVRWIAQELGKRLRVEPVFVDEESPTALLNNPAQCERLFGPPRASVEDILDLVSNWVRLENPTLGKPTKFEVRNGKF